MPDPLGLLRDPQVRGDVSSPVSDEEYTALRAELQTILTVRFSLLTADIALFGAVLGFSLSSPAALRPLTPWVLVAVIVPSMIANYYLSKHFSRIGGYILARFEYAESPMIFMRTLDFFKRSERHYAAYSEPILLTYCLLATVSVVVSLLSVFLLGAATAGSAALAEVGALVLVASTALIVRNSLSVRATDMSDDQAWQEALNAALAEQRAEAIGEPRAWVFVDRDGVINENLPGHVKNMQEFRFIEGSVAALAKLTAAGLGIVVVTNQPWVGETEHGHQSIRKLHSRLAAVLRAQGAYIDAIYYCPHSEAVPAECECRKPGLGMLKRAQRDLGVPKKPTSTNFELEGYLVGDQIGDIQLGVRAGLLTLLVRTGVGEQTELELAKNPTAEQPTEVCQDLAQAADWIIRHVDLDESARSRIS